MNIKTRQTVSVLLSVASSIGTVATIYLARKAAIKETRLEKFSSEDPEAKKKRFKQLLPIYIPTAIVGTATIAATVSSTIISRKTEASLTAMALFADQGWRRYKGTVKKMFGMEKNADILKEISKKDFSKLEPRKKTDGRVLYHNEYLGWFLADPVLFAFSYGEINQRLQIEDYGETSFYTTLDDLVKHSKAELLNKDIDKNALLWGWSLEYLLEAYSYTWIHMVIDENKTDDGTTYFEIEFIEDPILNPGNYNEDFVERQEPDEPSAFLPVMGMVGDRDGDR